MADGSVIVTGEVDGRAYVAKFTTTTGALEWETTVTGTAYSVGYAISALPDGSAIVTGEVDGVEGVANFGDGISLTHSNRAAFVAKISASGQGLWASGAGGSGARADGLGLVSLSNGTILVTGTIEKTVSFGSTTLTSDDESEDVFVACLSAAGSFGCSTSDFPPPPAAPGTLDTGFAPKSNNNVQSVTTIGDKILIGGDFTSVNGTTRTRVARLNADGSLDTGFGTDTTGANVAVEAIAVQSDGKVLIVGAFTSVSGRALTRIARLEADGTLDTGFTPWSGANWTVSSVVVQANGRILVAGGFFKSDADPATTRNGLARLNADGTLDSDFDAFSGPDVIGERA